MADSGRASRSSVLPPSVAALLTALDPAQWEQSWSAFLREHSNLILHVCRSLGGDRDAVMDRYAHTIEHLAENGGERFRKFTPSAGTKFSTWLVVVVRRLCLDHHRSVYGRPRGSSPDVTTREARRSLADSVSVELDIDQLVSAVDAPDLALRQKELTEHLQQALATLPARSRLLLALRFGRGYSAQRIANVMGFPTVFHVYRSINRELGTLRSELQRLGVRGPQP